MIGLVVILVSYLIAQGILFVYFIRKIQSLQIEFKNEILINIGNITELLNVYIKRDLRLIYCRLDNVDAAINNLRKNSNERLRNTSYL